MGRIKTALTKRAAQSLFRDYPNKFTVDFEANKKLVSETLDYTSKKLKNIVAGYLVRLVRKQKEEAS